MDLKFPHHECEIAQNVGAHGQESQVSYWIHGNMLTVNGRKMSKSEGNGFTPDELFTGNHKLLEKGYSPMTVRFFMLQGHYAGTLDFSNPALQAAEKGLERLMSAWKLTEELQPVAAADGVEAGAGPGRVAGARLCGDERRLQHAHPDCGPVRRGQGGQFRGVRAYGLDDADQIVALKSLFADFAQDILGLEHEGDAGVERPVDGLMEVLCALRAEGQSQQGLGHGRPHPRPARGLGVTIKDGKDGDLDDGLMKLRRWASPSSWRLQISRPAGGGDSRTPTRGPTRCTGAASCQRSDPGILTGTAPTPTLPRRSGSARVSPMHRRAPGAMRRVAGKHTSKPV